MEAAPANVHEVIELSTQRPSAPALTRSPEEAALKVSRATTNRLLGGRILQRSAVDDAGPLRKFEPERLLRRNVFFATRFLVEFLTTMKDTSRFYCWRGLFYTYIHNVR